MLSFQNRHPMASKVISKAIQEYFEGKGKPNDFAETNRIDNAARNTRRKLLSVEPPG